MSATNRKSERSPGDFYQTPAWCVRELYTSLSLPFPTLDPCAGNGSLVYNAQQLFPAQCLIRGVELNPDLVDECKVKNLPVRTGDGLDVDWSDEHVLMNPPYSEAEKWVYKAVTEAQSAAVLLRLGFLASQRRMPFLQKYPPAQIVVLSSRPSFTGHGTDACDYAWFVWRSEWPVYKGIDLRWISRKRRS